MCYKRQVPDVVSPGLQPLEIRLSNLWSLSSGQSCRILERTYRSASGRLSLKKSPGFKTNGIEPLGPQELGLHPTERSCTTFYKE